MIVTREIDKEIILERLNIIQKAVSRLKRLKDLSAGEFAMEDNFAIAEHNLRYALEATFDICGHILSRIPGNKSDEYKQMAKGMGKNEIVPNEFAEEKLVEMAGYRNRLTHIYFEVTGEEIKNIVDNDLDDFRKFNRFIKKFLEKI